VEGGVNFSGYFNPTISQTGHVAFVGFVAGPGISTANNQGIWWDAGGALNAVARAGPAGPGPNISGLRFDGFRFEPPVSGDSSLALVGILGGPGVTTANAFGHWAKPSPGAPLTPFMRTVDSTYGPNLGPGVHFGANAASPLMNRSGYVAFAADLTGTGINSTNNRGIWSHDSAAGGGLTLLARTGPAGPGPGVEPGVDFSFFTDPVVNAAGKVAFHGSLAGTGIDTTNRVGVWVREGGANVVVARTGPTGPGPGMAPGVTFSGIDAPVINAAGHVGFAARVTGTGVDDTNREGIWTGGAGDLRLVARTGAAGPGPGLGAGVQFTDLRPPVLTNGGHVGFSARLTGAGVTTTNDNGYWLASPGRAPQAIARTGAAGTDAGLGPRQGPGVHFDTVQFQQANAAGQVAFMGGLTGTGVTAGNGSGLWAYNGGTLQKVARTGDLFDLDPTAGEDLRQIKSIDFGHVNILSGGGDGRRTTLNDSGELAFQMTFVDNSVGIFKAPATSTTTGR
jgi:hypothetical protein